MNNWKLFGLIAAFLIASAELTYKYKLTLKKGQSIAFTCIILLCMGICGLLYLICIKGLDIVGEICKNLDLISPRVGGESHKELIEFVEDRPGHDFRYAVDCSKISNTLGWIPKISFNDGIEGTIKWYLDHSNWWGKIIKKKYDLSRLGVKK